MSKLIYGIQVWGFCQKYLLQKFHILQNKAARLVLGNKSLKYNNIKLLQEVNWLPVDKLVTLHMSKLCHQILNTGSPKYLYERLVPNSNVNTRSNMGNKLGTKPKNTGKSQFTKDTFCSRIYEVYNKIPSELTSITDKKQFGKYLKKIPVRQ